MDNKDKRDIKWTTFLWDVFLCSLGSYGGPEAHYGVFSSILIDGKNYINEEEMAELIGLFALVPGPGSTQTITAIGYYVGGPVLAFLTFLVWALPAIIIMGLFGVFFSIVDNIENWKPIIKYLPAVAVSFIVYAAITLSRKVLQNKSDYILYGIMIFTSLLLVKLSMWFVPILLIVGGIYTLFNGGNYEKKDVVNKIDYKPKWSILGIVVGLAIFNEILVKFNLSHFINLYASFYRYGYSVIGGGQIVIPLMIQDLVETQSLLSINDFLSGYAIDQAVPGPLFSFAAFVSARSFAGTGLSFLAGIIGGLSIFLPGILLVFFIFPLWKNFRKLNWVKLFLNGVTITGASLIVMTGITQIINLPLNIIVYFIVVISTILLFTKKIPAPLIVIFSAILGFII